MRRYAPEGGERRAEPKAGSAGEVLLSSGVEACIQIGRVDAVAAQMRKFAVQGGLAALTSQTYGSLVKAYAQAGDAEKRWELWNDMEQREVMPTSVTVGCFVDARGNNGCAEEVLSLVHQPLRDSKRASLVNNDMSVFLR